MTWAKQRIGEHFDISHGFAFKGEFFGDSGKYVIVTPGNFYEPGGFRQRGDRTKFYTQTPPDEYVLKKGDLIIAMTEQGEGLLGSSAIVPEDHLYLHNQRIGLVENLNEDKLDKRFLYYLLNTQPVRAQIRATATGAKVKHTAPTRIRKVVAPLPPVAIQARIASICSAYDDLIENNNRRMALLEEAIHLLYREWFVNLRFPGHERVKVADGVPDGWERTTMQNAVSYLGGGTPTRKTAEFWTGAEINWYSPTDLTRAGLLFMEQSGERINELGLARSSAQLFPPFSVMLTSRATIGAIAINTTPACTNQGFITCLPNDRVPLYFLYCWLNSNREQFIARATGSTFKELSKSKFGTIPIVVPAFLVTDAFEGLVAPLGDQVLCLQRQNEMLREARDLLLPRLMDGSLVV